MQFVRADLVRHRIAATAIAYRCAVVGSDRKQVHATAAQCRGRFAADNGRVWKPCMKRGVLRRFTDALGTLELGCITDAFPLVIETDDIQRSGQRHLGRGVVHRHRSRARRVLCMHDGAQRARNRRALFAGVLLANLVAHAPQHHRGMIAVAAQHRAQIGGMPLPKHQMKIQRGLLHLPTVEHLVHHQQTHAVGQVEQFGRRRVMAHANGVGAHLLQQLQLPLGGAPVERRAERAQVVMIVHPADRHVLAIDQ